VDGCSTYFFRTLAGLPLAASYRLAVAGQQSELGSQHELSVEQGKIVIRSSIAGLFILLISFAFFYIFVIEVYKIKVVDVDDGQQSSYQWVNTLPTRTGETGADGVKLGFGALGHPSGEQKSPIDAVGAVP
jgi:hypothetical protein